MFKPGTACGLKSLQDGANFPSVNQPICEITVGNVITNFHIIFT